MSFLFLKVRYVGDFLEILFHQGREFMVLVLVLGLAVVVVCNSAKYLFFVVVEVLGVVVVVVVVVDQVVVVFSTFLVGLFHHFLWGMDKRWLQILL